MQISARAQPTIRFFTTSNVLGVPLRSALNPHFNGLANGGQTVAFPEGERKSSISICLQVRSAIIFNIITQR